MISTLETANTPQQGELEEDFENDTENSSSSTAETDTREGDELVARGENALVNDLELINLEDENDKEI